MKLIIYTTPHDTLITIHHDTAGWTLHGSPDVDKNGRTCQSIDIPADTPDWNGCELTISRAGKVSINIRAILVMVESDKEAHLLVDDFMLMDTIVEPPVITPTKYKNPLELVTGEFARNLFNYSTKEGCGQFTEHVCRMLHFEFYEFYGHIRKTGAQNQYNGHAVDAIQVLKTYENPDGSTTYAGIYDLIINSESSDARPSFNLKSAPASELWYYPA